MQGYLYLSAPKLFVVIADLLLTRREGVSSVDDGNAMGLAMPPARAGDLPPLPRPAMVIAWRASKRWIRTTRLESRTSPATNMTSRSHF
jgi:hypothetical protein